MPEFVYLRPTPQPEGQRPLVVFLYDGRRVPAEGRRVEVDRHVRMLLRDGDVEVFTPAPKTPRAAAPVVTQQTDAPEAPPTKSQRRVRAEEPTT